MQVAGRKIRFLTLPPKSACMSPLDCDRGRALDGDVGPDDPCLVLQRQAGPLVAIIKDLPKGVDHVVVLADFNRNWAREAALVAGAEPVCRDASTDLTKPRPAGVVSRNVWPMPTTGSRPHRGWRCCRPPATVPASPSSTPTLVSH